MNITMTRENLLSHLETKLKYAEREDARIKAEHERDEQAALEKFRKKLREAIAWDYKTAKRKTERYSNNNLQLDAPACPKLQATEIRRVIDCIKLDGRKSGSYEISEKGINDDVWRAVHWKPAKDRAKETVCD